jgi:hypothetical protein
MNVLGFILSFLNLSENKMSILIFFLIILLLIKIVKLETKLSFLLALLITYAVYTNKSIKNQIKYLTNSTKKQLNMETIPEIFLKDWYKYWASYLRNITDYNKENYLDIMKSLKHFQQYYLEVINGSDLGHQKLDNMSLLQKEILNMMQSTVLSLPVSQGEQLENILIDKLEFLKKELEFRINEIRNYINNDWDSGNINNMTKPIYNNTLTSIPPDYSANYSFY